MDLRLPFDLELTVDDAPVAAVSGVAVLSPDPFGLAPDAKHTNWFLADIELAVRDPDTTAPGVELVTVPEDHVWHDLLMVQLINAKRAEMDAAWDRHMGGAIVAARSRFVVVPAAATTPETA